METIATPQCLYIYIAKKTKVESKNQYVASSKSIPNNLRPIDESVFHKVFFAVQNLEMLQVDEKLIFICYSMKIVAGYDLSDSLQLHLRTLGMHMQNAALPYLVVTTVSIWLPCLSFAICIGHNLPCWLDALLT